MFWFFPVPQAVDGASSYLGPSNDFLSFRHNGQRTPTSSGFGFQLAGSLYRTIMRICQYALLANNTPDAGRRRLIVLRCEGRAAARPQRGKPGSTIGITEMAAYDVKLST
jgi:hypothetical protein